MNNAKKNRGLLPMVTGILAWIYPVCFLFFQNAKEMAFTEMIKPMGIFVLGAVVTFVIGWATFRDQRVGGIFSLLCGLFLGNFMLILDAVQRVLPGVRYWHLMYVGLLFIIVICIFLKGKEIAGDLVQGATLALGGLILFNGVVATPSILRRAADARNNGDVQSYQVRQVDGKRNIYYILCDEYASFEQLEHDFQYDNSIFRNKLRSLGFNISDTSTNYYTATSVIMANLMQLEYVATPEDTSAKLEGWSKNSKLWEIVAENGYAIKGIGDTEWLGLDGMTEKNGGSKTVDGVDVSGVLLDRSFIGPLLKERIYVTGVKMILDTLDSMETLQIQPHDSTFYMCYLCCPHHPYYFDSQGNMNPTQRWINDESGKNNDAYLEQLEFLTNRIVKIVERIVTNDPDSIVILCSDHGNRFGPISEGMTTKILNCLYYVGEQISDFEGKSGINTMIYILNREMGMDMDDVEKGN